MRARALAFAKRWQGPQREESEAQGQMESATKSGVEMAGLGGSARDIGPQAQQIFDASSRADVSPVNSLNQLNAALQQRKIASTDKLSEEIRSNRAALGLRASQIRSDNEIQLIEDGRNAKRAQYAHQLSEGQLKPEDLGEALASDPLFRGSGAIANRALIEATAAQLTLADAEPKDVRSFLAQVGAPVDIMPKHYLRAFTPGTDRNGNYVPPRAFLTPRSRLVLLGDEGSNTRKSVEVLESAMKQLDDLEAVTEIIREQPLTGRRAADAIATRLGLGIDSGDVAAFIVLTNVMTPGIARATSEVGSLTEPEQDRARASMPGLIELLRSNDRQIAGRFTAARRFLENRMYGFTAQGYPGQTKMVHDRYEAARKRGIAESKVELRGALGVAEPDQVSSEELKLLGGQ